MKKDNHQELKPTCDLSELLEILFLFLLLVFLGERTQEGGP